MEKMDCYKKMIIRLDLRIGKLSKMRKNITLDMMYLLISEENKKITEIELEDELKKHRRIL